MLISHFSSQSSVFMEHVLQCLKSKIKVVFSYFAHIVKSTQILEISTHTVNTQVEPLNEYF